MLKTVLSKVFGTRHERERKRIQPIVDEINEHAPQLERYTAFHAEFARAYMDGADRVALGRVLRQPDLARTLERIAADLGGGRRRT